MKPFKVYAHPHGDYEAVESGWSWNACGFGPFWALFNKMWAVGVGMLATLVVVWGIAAVGLGTEQANLIINVGSVLSCVVFGAYGPHWQQAHLEARGFVCQDTVTAADGKDAVDRYLTRCADPARAAGYRDRGAGRLTITIQGRSDLFKVLTADQSKLGCFGSLLARKLN